jgi:LysR family transcriptional regulator for bpeEF and oprC
MRRKLFDTRIVSVASPAYLDKHGEPKTPDDLDAHACIGHLEVRTGRYRALELEKDKQTYVKYPSGRLNINDSQSLLASALAGVGIARLATFVAADAVRAGKLRVILKDYVCVGPEIAIFYLPSRQLSPRVQTFTQFLVSLLPRNPPWDDILA